MSKTRYTGVTKDDKTGKYTYYFKAGVDLATGKPYQERRRGFQTAKEAFEARTRALNKIQQKGGIKHTQWTFKQFMEEVFMRLAWRQAFYISHSSNHFIRFFFCIPL